MAGDPTRHGYRDRPRTQSPPRGPNSNEEDTMTAAKGESQGASSFVTPRLVAIVILVVAVGAFVIQNTNSEDLNWLWLSFSAPLWLMLAIVGAVGFVVGYLVGRPGKAARRSS